MRGQHGAFWMQPQSPAASHGSPARTGTEIDVAEFFGRGAPDGGLGSYVYSYPRPGTTVKRGRVLRSASRALSGRNDSWWSRYHVFSVHWTRTGSGWRIRRESLVQEELAARLEAAGSERERSEILEREKVFVSEKAA